MKNTKYSQDEIKIYKKALKIILEELEELWNATDLEEIKIPVILNGIEKEDKYKPYENWKFIMTKDAWYLSGYTFSHEYRAYFAKKNKFGQWKKLLNIQPIDIIFMREYDEIKSKIEEKVRKTLKEKELDLTIAQNIINRKEKEATIEIKMPPSNNQHQIKINQENGRTIGVIDFGSRLIKIVTDGSIVLVPQEDYHKKENQEKVKRI